MYKFIIMHCGYVESNMTSALIFQCQFFGHPGYTSRKEAITELALDMYAKFYDEHLSIYQNRYLREVKKCCRDSLVANRDAKFCSNCGDQLKDKEFNYDEFMEFVSNLHSSTCDSYGDAEETSTRNLCWWPYWTNNFIGAPREEIIYIAESAEVILLAALLDAKPELKSEESELNFIGSDDWDKFKNEIQPSYT
jgi:hypothetical protein